MGTIWGKRNKEEERKNERKSLTLTGPLMEGSRSHLEVRV
jgi:hypothetical protein